MKLTISYLPPYTCTLTIATMHACIKCTGIGSLWMFSHRSSCRISVRLVVLRGHLKCSSSLRAGTCVPSNI